MLQRAAQTVRVNGRKASRVPRVDRSQEADALGTAKFAQNDAVGTKAQRSLKQFVGSHLGFAQLTLHGHQTDTVLARQFELRGILHEYHALVFRDLAQHGVEECGLAGTRATRNQNGTALPDRFAQKGDRFGLRIGHGPPLRRCERSRVVSIERKVEAAVAADRHRPVLARRGRTAELDTRAAGQSRTEQRVFAVDPLVTDAGDLFGKALDQPVVDVGANDALHAPDTGIFHPNLARAVHQDFGYRIPFKPFPERRKVSVEIDAPFPVQIDGWRVVFRVVVRMEGMDIGAHDRVRLSLPLRSPDRAL